MMMIGSEMSEISANSANMIARFEDENDDVVTVVKPYILIAAQNGMALAPYMFTIAPDTKVKLKINNVICVVKSAKDASDMYIKQSTGLTVANASGT